MSAFYMGVLLVIICTIIEGFAQIGLKKSTFAPSPNNNKKIWIIFSLLLFGVEAVLYTSALERLDISTAYPLGALGFVTITILSRWLLHEKISPKRWLGVGLIMGGCALITL